MGLFDRRAAEEPPAAVTPPVDLSTPVSNPELVAQMRRAVQLRTADQVQPTMQLQRGATYLLAMTLEGPGIVDGVMQAGTRMTVYSVLLPDDRTALALFTDWPSLHAAVGDEPSWRGLVLPGDDALTMALTGAYPGGAVINPFGPEISWPLPPDQVRLVLEHTSG